MVYLLHLFPSGSLEYVISILMVLRLDSWQHRSLEIGDAFSIFVVETSVEI